MFTTQRAPDGWDFARYLAGFWLRIGSVKLRDLVPPTLGNAHRWVLRNREGD
jgi:hypothetical protein